LKRLKRCKDETIYKKEKIEILFQFKEKGNLPKKILKTN
jgi:hypothetical protein